MEKYKRLSLVLLVLTVIFFDGVESVRAQVSNVDLKTKDEIIKILDGAGLQLKRKDDVKPLLAKADALGIEQFHIDNALMDAANYGGLEVARELFAQKWDKIDAGVLSFLVSKFSDQPFTAVLAEEILEKRSDIDKESIAQALQNAAEGGSLELFKKLLKRSDIENKTVLESLKRAVDGIQVEVVKELLLQKGTIIDSMAIVNAFKKAVDIVYGKSDTVVKEFLVQRGKDIDVRVVLDAFRDLGKKSSFNPSVIEVLITLRGDDINADEVGKMLINAVSWSYGSPSPVLVEILLKKPGLDKDYIGKALPKVANSKNIPIIGILLSKFPDLDKNYIADALREAVHNRSLGAVQEILKYSVTADKIDENIWNDLVAYTQQKRENAIVKELTDFKSTKKIR